MTDQPHPLSSASGYLTKAAAGSLPGALQSVKSQRELVYHTTRAGATKTVSHHGHSTNVREHDHDARQRAPHNEIMFYNTSAHGHSK